MINLIPMAGLGNRFFQEHYKTPKPFIPVLGKPMFITSASSFPAADKYIFLCRSEHIKKYNLQETIAGVFENNVLVEVKSPTEGQACTCLLAEEYLEYLEGLFIASCDYEAIYDKKKYEALLKDDSIDVIIWTFKIGSIKKANPNAFAYCRVEADRVVEVVEKKTISDTPENDPAVVGSFTYKNCGLFLTGAKKMIEKNIRVNNEFYVGTSINQLIEEGAKVVTFEVEHFISFGNPFELEAVNYWQEFFDKLEDHPYKISYGYKQMR